MNYTVSFLFSPDLKEVLLIRKNRTSFAGKYNGVGGKIEPSYKSNEDSALREIKKETGISELRQFSWLGSLCLPWDCASNNSKATIHFFSGIIYEGDTARQTTDEVLKWFSVQDVLETPVSQSSMFAGEGDVQYFIRQALRKFEEVALGV